MQEPPSPRRSPLLLFPYRWITARLRRKASIGLLLFLLLVVVVIGQTTIARERKMIFDGLQRQASSISRFVAIDLEGVLEAGGGRGMVISVLTRVCSDPGVIYSQLLDGQGRPYAAACKPPEPATFHPLPPRELTAILPENPRLVAYGDVLDLYRRVDGGDQGPMYLLMGFDATESRTIASRVAQVVGAQALAVYLVGMAILLLAVKRLTLPLEELTAGIRKVGEGGTPGPLAVTGDDEVADVSGAFDRMVGELDRSRKEIGRYQRHLEEMVKERTEDLVAANRSLEESNSKLRELDRLKSNFLGIASHELKTPVAVISGYLEYLEAGGVGELTPVQQQVVSAAHASCARMGLLIGDMLDLTRIETGRMPMQIAPRPLRTAVKGALGHLSPLIEKRQLALEVEQEGLDEVAFFDNERIEQVLVNLVGNAVKFTPDGGRVVIRCFRMEEKGQGRVRVQVEDTGIGISPEDLPHIFDEFAQVGPAGKVEGTGLGLAICRRIMAAHGGTVSAESKLGKGSVFAFTLPAP